MGYQEKDSQLQKQIIGALFERQLINMNKEIGVAYCQAEDEDKINPSVVLTMQEIKDFTNRAVFRPGPVWREYADSLQRPGVVVEQLNQEAMRISLVPIRAKSNEFGSVLSMKELNNAELKANPELGEPPY
jgi:hypothetical protein